MTYVFTHPVTARNAPDSEPSSVPSSACASAGSSSRAVTCRIGARTNQPGSVTLKAWPTRQCCVRTIDSRGGSDSRALLRQL
jgi:hypothetical protein